MPTALRDTPVLRDARQVLEDEGEQGLEAYMQQPVILKNAGKKVFGSKKHAAGSRPDQHLYESMAAALGRENYALSPGEERIVPLHVVFAFVGNPYGIERDRFSERQRVQQRLQVRYGKCETIHPGDIEVHHYYKQVGVERPLPDVKGQIPNLVVKTVQGDDIDAPWPLYFGADVEEGAADVADVSDLMTENVALQDRLSKLERTLDTLAEKAGAEL